MPKRPNARSRIPALLGLPPCLHLSGLPCHLRVWGSGGVGYDGASSVVQGKACDIPLPSSGVAEVVFILGRYILGGPSASICDSGLSRSCSFLFDPICLLLSSTKKCLGLAKFLSKLR